MLRVVVCVCMRLVVERVRRVVKCVDEVALFIHALELDTTSEKIRT